VAAPAVEAEQAFNHRGYALTVFVAPLLFGSVLEAGLALVSDRVPRRRLMAGALFALGGSLALCASARSGKDVGATRESADREDAAAIPIRQALQAAAANRGLWLWLSGCALCTLLDEIVVGLATLHLQNDLGFSQATAATCAVALSVGGAFGAATTDVLLARTGSTRLLIGSAAVSLGALGAALGSHSLFSLLPALFLLGVGAPPQYGLLKARAYAAVPGQPGVVNALAQLFVALDVAAPFALGALADRFGLAVALGALAMQPLGVLVVTLLGRRPNRDCN
jgi:predicted MFS family arabinose efflux permease